MPPTGGWIRVENSRFDLRDTPNGGKQRVEAEDGDYAEYMCWHCKGILFAPSTNSNMNQFARGDRGRDQFGDQGRQLCAEDPKQCQQVASASPSTTASVSAVASSSTSPPSSSSSLAATASSYSGGNASQEDRYHPVADSGPSYTVDDNPSFTIQAARAVAREAQAATHSAQENAKVPLEIFHTFDQVLRPVLAREGHFAATLNPELAMAVLRVEEARASYVPTPPATSAASSTTAADAAVADPPPSPQEAIPEWKRVAKTAEARSRGRARDRERTMDADAEAAVAKKSMEEAEAYMLKIWGLYG